METQACPVLTPPQPASIPSPLARNQPLTKTRFPTLITPDAPTGLKLAGELALALTDQLDRARSNVQRPPAMNYVLPPSVPPELITGILFYAISAANNGWVE